MDYEDHHQHVFDDDDDDEEMQQLKAMAREQFLRRKQGGFGVTAAEDHHMNNYDDEDEYGDEEEEDEDDDNEEDDEEIDEEAAARMMMMMDEQEKLFLQQQMALEHQYIKAATAAAGGMFPMGVSSAGALPSHMNNMIGGIGDDIIGEEGGNLMGAEEDLILAGGSGAVGQHQLYEKDMKPIELKSWLQWYLALEDHEFLVEVEREFLKDKFNFINLRETIGTPAPMPKKRFKEALKLILSTKVPSEEELQNQKFLELNQDAFDLYGRIHRRFIETPVGLAKIYQKFLKGVYGTCPRVHCDRQRLLPMGMYDKPKVSRVKVYCPRCEESYVPNRLSSHYGKASTFNLDGSIFGVSFPQIFIKHFSAAVVVPPKIHYY